MNNNPFKFWTQIYKIFEILSDLQWHCSEHELPWSQPAKALQMIRQAWYEMEKTWQNYEKRMFCDTCKRKTPFRKLISLEKTEESIERSKTLNPKLKERIIKIFKNKDAFLGYEPSGRKIEVDHRIPQIRWIEKEEDYINITDEELIEKFMLLVREHNLLKSRNCEKCVVSGQRQPFLGINFFYEWSERYENNIWCKWCGWHNPEIWKEKLNNKIACNKQE